MMCDKCGKELPLDVNFCSACGNNLIKKKEETANENKIGMVALYLLLLVPGIILGLVVLIESVMGSSTTLNHQIEAFAFLLIALSFLTSLVLIIYGQTKYPDNKFYSSLLVIVIIVIIICLGLSFVYLKMCNPCLTEWQSGKCD